MGNWDFDGDEALFFLVAGITTVVVLLQWYVPLVRMRGIDRRGGFSRILLAVTPLAAVAGLGFVLTNWADPQYVVGQLDYQLLFLAGGGIWIGAADTICTMLGVSRRDDAIERGNEAAALAIAGAVLGGMAMYAGGNVGAGPTIWTTLVPALAGTLVWFAIWLIVELTTHPAEAIAIDRDVAGGIRQGAWLLSAGLVLGRAVAGDWTAWESTFGDVITLGWPALGFAGAGGVLNLFLRPTPARPHPPVIASGVMPAAVLIALAAAYVAALGPADIGEHVITYEEYIDSR